MNEQLASYLYSHSPYRGKRTPENLLFNANLQQFARRLSLISSLESNGKISPPDAYQEIENLWESFQSIAKDNLP